MLGPGERRNSAGGDAGKLRLSQRLLLRLPHLLARDEEKAPLGERLRHALLKPVEPDDDRSPNTPAARSRSVDELEVAARSADDKERLIGLLAAPLAGAIGLLIIDALISHDPAALLRNGRPNKLHVSVSLYHDLALVLMALAVLMLVTAWFRKRLYLGMVMALYGLAVFNLHYWGFGVPFIMVAAWLLVRSYRLQREWKEATGATPVRGRDPGRARWRTADPAPQASKRYTPPAPPPRRPPSRRTERQRRAG
jgi:hypothetical protein